MKTILFIYGTRPEAIKMAPLINEMKKYPNDMTVKICLTGQHREMLDQINQFFNIKGDYDLNLMSSNQTLFDIMARCLVGLKDVLEEVKPDIIFVQGDTTSVLAGAIAGFFKMIPVAHLEAGLRSGEKYSPFPEEMNRTLTGHISEFHFCPTKDAVDNLKREGIIKNVFVVGNTVIDALYLGLSMIHAEGDTKYLNYFTSLGIDIDKKNVLITGHRRESFGEGFEHICSALSSEAKKHPKINFIYPMHMNPNVREPVLRHLSGITNIYLIEPLPYPFLIWLLEKAYFVITDSGGIQEEAPSLGKPVLIMRDVTERKEGIIAGNARLIGTKYEVMKDAIEELIMDEAVYKKMSTAINPYGDGKTSSRIVQILLSININEGI
jgi:UDP-N-acetylglucosamine 2-epimerase (non-hydrolysing)